MPSIDLILLATCFLAFLPSDFSSLTTEDSQSFLTWHAKPSTVFPQFTFQLSLSPTPQTHRHLILAMLYTVMPHDSCHSLCQKYPFISIYMTTPHLSFKIQLKYHFILEAFSQLTHLFPGLLQPFFILLTWCTQFLLSTHILNINVPLLLLLFLLQIHLCIFLLPWLHDFQVHLSSFNENFKKAIGFGQSYSSWVDKTCTHENL